MARTGETAKLVDGITHARKHFTGEQGLKFALRAGGLMVHKPETFHEPYRTLYSRERYTHLTDLFTSTHHTLLSLPPTPLLHIALSAGLSALKTPSCHSPHTHAPTTATTTSINPSTNPPSTLPTQNTSPLSPICPICSTELNALAKNVPYAHHTKSIIEEDPVVLPNGRVFGRERLRVLNEKLGVRQGWVRDPTVGEGEGVEREWEEGGVRRVFIS